MADRIPNSTVNLPASGEFQPPPSNAPREITLPGSERPTADQIRQARSNERDLPTFAPKPMTVEQMAGYLGKSVDEIRAMRGDSVTVPAPTLPPAAPLHPPATLVDPTGRPVVSSIKPVDLPLPSQDPSSLRSTARRGSSTSLRPSIDHTRVDAVVASPVEQPLQPARTEAGADADQAGSIPADGSTSPAAPSSSLADAARATHPRTDVTDEPYYPAKSDTDSPSRGIPTARPAGKEITGGFGDLGEAQYFPLDGIEAGKVAVSLLQSLIERIRDDLRFSIAATYPRVTMRAVLEVECFAADHSFQIEKRLIPPHERTPLDVARNYGDQIVFCVVAQHLEMSDTGESITPPNAARLELGLPIPRKHVVATPGGKVLVDVATPGAI